MENANVLVVEFAVQVPCSVLKTVPRQKGGNENTSFAFSCLWVWWRDSVVSLKAAEWLWLRGPQGYRWGEQMGNRCLQSRPAVDVKMRRFLGSARNRSCNKYSGLWKVREFALRKDFPLLSWEQGWREKSCPVRSNSKIHDHILLFSPSSVTLPRNRVEFPVLQNLLNSNLSSNKTVLHSESPFSSPTFKWKVFFKALACRFPSHHLLMAVGTVVFLLVFLAQPQDFTLCFHTWAMTSFSKSF